MAVLAGDQRLRRAAAARGRSGRGGARARLTAAPPPTRRNAYNMVINKFGDRLYNGLVETITGHLRSVAGRVEATQGEGFLRELKTRWEAHNKSMQMIRDILMVRAPAPAPPWDPRESEPAPRRAHSRLAGDSAPPSCARLRCPHLGCASWSRASMRLR
jgi:hypothetical protein